MEDADFIVRLRNLEHAKGRLGDSAKDVNSQEAWLKAYFQREGDYYFIIETRNGTPVGAYGIYNVIGRSAESGRWVIQPEVPAAIPSAILAFDLAFGELGMIELRVKTVSTNLAVLSLNKRFGFRQTRIESGAQVIEGKAIDMVHFMMKADEWAKHRPKLLTLARYAEAQIQDWEKVRETA
jgi:RimJ/RimL family protein N-acetyltransferase